jgi:GxxExxY protein
LVLAICVLGAALAKACANSFDDFEIGQWQRKCSAERSMRTQEQLNAISEQIIGAAIEVHRRVGPDCLESTYSPCFALELTRRKLDFRREVSLPLKYDELLIPRAYVADYGVEGVVVELKAVSRLTPEHWRQLHTYLKVSGYPLGLLLNFGASSITGGMKRIANNFPQGTEPMHDTPALIG